jgi:hypothetical protein
VGTWTEMRGSMESSKFHLQNRRSRPQFSFSGPGSSQHASHQLSTRHEARYHRGCGTNLAARRRSGGHNVVDCGQCRFRHREGNMPIVCQFGLLVCDLKIKIKIYIPSWQNAEHGQSHCLVLIGDCFPEFLATKTGQRLPSCAQSFLVLELVPSPIGMALDPHHIPYRRG